jgi:hypothetical protein
MKNADLVELAPKSESKQRNPDDHGTPFTTTAEEESFPIPSGKCPTGYKYREKHPDGD